MWCFKIPFFSHSPFFLFYGEKKQWSTFIRPQNAQILKYSMSQYLDALVFFSH